eukprot:m.43374 g.43374  ORF g.43374 m.43374 type:complete len:272 (-) comp10778_c0_seq5:697-1512(-)
MFEERKQMLDSLYIRFKDEQRRRRALHNQLMEIHGNIRVHVRVRPLLQSELRSKNVELHTAVVHCTDTQTVHALAKEDDVREFEFDRAFGAEDDNERVFLELQTLVTSFIDGYNVCVFAYGQTGSGKTHTMLGPDGVLKVSGADGVVFRCTDEVFKLCSERQTECTTELSVTVVEIYNDKIRDLIGDPEESHQVVTTGDHGVYVPSLHSTNVTTKEEVIELINHGLASRAKVTERRSCHGFHFDVSQVGPHRSWQIAGAHTSSHTLLADEA